MTNDIINDIMNKPVNNNIKNGYYIWLYSSGYSGGWWCYDKESNEHIENIYNDYNTNKYLIKDADSSDDNNNISIKINANKASKPNKIIRYDSFDNIEIDSDSCSDLQFNDDIVNNNLTSTNNLTASLPLIYQITINNEKYKIDFDLMKQIKINDPTKKRGIKRIIIPIEYLTSYKSVVEFLFNGYNILGLSGKKFDKY